MIPKIQTSPLLPAWVSTDLPATSAVRCTQVSELPCKHLRPTALVGFSSSRGIVLRPREWTWVSGTRPPTRPSPDLCRQVMLLLGSSNKLLTSPGGTIAATLKPLPCCFYLLRRVQLAASLSMHTSQKLKEFQLLQLLTEEEACSISVADFGLQQNHEICPKQNTDYHATTRSPAR